jgi:hypothetical protein
MFQQVHSTIRSSFCTKDVHAQLVIHRMWDGNQIVPFLIINPQEIHIIHGELLPVEYSKNGAMEQYCPFEDNQGKGES